MTGRSPPLDVSTRRRRERGASVEIRSIPALTVIWHPDPARVGDTVRLTQVAAGHKVLLSRLEPSFGPPGGARGAPLGDAYLSRRPLELHGVGDRVRIVPVSGGSDIAIDGVIVSEPREISRDQLEEGIVLELARRVVLLLHLVGPPRERGPTYGLAGESDAVEAVRDAIARVARLDVAVLVRGETGVGKELVAHALHQVSGRSGACVSVNMAALPPSLAAAELFGYAKGAFTGATRDHEGLFAQADHGTLFMDEVGETPPEVQAMLLRVLESSAIHPIGRVTPRHVDVRLLAATDADLERAVAEKRFRAPLLHRLSSYQILVPPLRSRRDDVGRLFLHFLRAELGALGELHRLAPREAEPWIAAGLVARLAAHAWPGNIRQLRNAVRQLAISNRGLDEVRVDAPLAAILGESPPITPEPTAHRGTHDVTHEELIAALEACRFRIGATAARLGVAKSTLYALMEQHPGIRKAKDLGHEEIAAAQRKSGGNLDRMAEELRVSRRGLRLRMSELGMK